MRMIIHAGSVISILHVFLPSPFLVFKFVFIDIYIKSVFFIF